MQYQTKLSYIDALQWTGDNLAEMTAFVQGLLGEQATVTPTLRNRIIVEGLEIAEGQFVVIHENKRVTALYSEVFIKTYEPKT